MGEAKRRREAGGFRRGTVDEVRDAPGHVRVTMLDSHDAGGTLLYPADEVAGLLDGLGEAASIGGLSLRAIAATPLGWARLREHAFRLVRTGDPDRVYEGCILGLWCAMRGPDGKRSSRTLSGNIAEFGRSSVVIRRDGVTGGFALLVSADATPAVLDAAKAAASLASLLPDGCALVDSRGRPGPVEH